MLCDPDDDRDEQDREQREGAHRRAQDAANHHAPSATG